MSIIEEKLEKALIHVPDFPKKGFTFIDTSKVIEDGYLFKELVGELCEKVSNCVFDKVLAVESRGFILGSALSFKMSKGLVLVRKKGKLPGPTIQRKYNLEYGSDQLEVLKSSVKKGERVIIIDDILATGGTINAVCQLAKDLGASVEALLFFIELGDLKGRETLSFPVQSVLNHSRG